mmetsp:Transcript_29121/g.76918  ORF Transcript_29121/g.76918 Transcript_29121/m.76918 type:complete len:136 (+) Transcript_29121:926-1333(+)
MWCRKGPRSETQLLSAHTLLRKCIEASLDSWDHSLSCGEGSAREQSSRCRAESNEEYAMKWFNPTGICITHVALFGSPTGKIWALLTAKWNTVFSWSSALASAFSFTEAARMSLGVVILCLLLRFVSFGGLITYL